jgi:predicted chitinase
MTYASIRSAAEHIARTGTITPHQLAAFTALWESMTDAQKQAFTELWRAAGSPAVAPRLISAAQALAVFGRAPAAQQLADLNACLWRFGINTPTRIRHFLAQVGHESGGLRWMLELASGDAYEGRKDLGNTQPGDGPRFKGAGAIQLTGRFNYQRLADFIRDQDVMDGAAYVANRYPFTSAGFWWHLNAINAFVDQGASCRQVSAKVNGRDPANGLADREAFFTRAVAAIPQTGRPVVGIQQQPAKVSGIEIPAGMVGPRKAPDLKPGDHHLVADDRRQSMDAFTHDGKRLWSIPCLCRGQAGDTEWKATGSDTPPGLYKVGKIYRDYEQDPSARFSEDRRSYGWYSFDLEGQEGQEGPNSQTGRDGIMIHGGGTACGWPGAWEPRQALHSTRGCIRLHNVDLRERVLPLVGMGTVWVSVLQEAS